MLKRIQNNTHPKGAINYALSSMLERGAYYGFRALLIIYLLGETIAMDRMLALSIIGLLTGSTILSKVIGALLGDLILGNRRTILIGGILQVMGIFSLFIPTTTGVYIGVFLMILGNGLFSPNLTANFGKLYFKKTTLLDAGFTLLYLLVNLGTFFGIMLIGYLGEKLGYRIGFILCGILMLCSLIPIVNSQEIKHNNNPTTNFNLNKRVSSILVVILLVSIFWTIHEIVNIRLNDLQTQFMGISSIGIPRELWLSLDSWVTFPIGIILFILWNYFYSSQFFKLTLGFLFGILYIGVLLIIPQTVTEHHAVLYYIAILLLSISEIHIAPIVHSVLTKYSNPKYLAIVISLVFLPSKLLYIILGLFKNKFIDNPILGLKFAITSMSIIGIGLITYIILNKRPKSKL
ncbi:MFS transporter [uncultured Tenacibaculum sp.]|uniref:POT-type proton-dependent oligopeptide transporter n=1 Tax=uncultured Tenacibaculum sp. TaxID=174713 RepID=UPI002635D435|nr:MFS transporter [uncultured Tenacibaculum sp.]